MKENSEKTKQQMNNLAALIGIDKSSEDSKEDDGFKLNLFPDIPSSSGIGGSDIRGIDNVINIDATDIMIENKKALAKKFDDFNVDNIAGGGGDDDG